MSHTKDINFFGFGCVSPTATLPLGYNGLAFAINSSGGRVFQNVNFPHRGTSPGASTPWSLILALIGFVGLCLLVGAANAAIVQTSLRTWYLALLEPPGTLPAWLFGPIWTALYVMMGVSAWMVWRKLGAGLALRLWGWQLLCDALWTPAFFGARSTSLGVLTIVLILVMVLATTRVFLRVSRPAGWLMLPYLGWSLYATYLNIGFWWLNLGGLG